MAMADAKFAGTAIVTSGMDTPRRTAARFDVQISWGIEPRDLAGLRIRPRAALALSVTHTRSGVVADAVAEQQAALTGPARVTGNISGF